MPPALSDEEGSEVDLALPVRGSLKPKSLHDPVGGPDFRAKSSSLGTGVIATKFDEVEEDDEEEEEEDEDDEGDLDEDEFIVEEIKKHMINPDGTLKFQVKWEGYNDKKDLTWEPEDNLSDSAADVLGEYLSRIGGREKIFEESEMAVKGKKRGRASSNGTPAQTKRSRRNGAHPADLTPPATIKQWQPPAGSWEDDVDSIDAAEEEESGKLMVYLEWKNGQKTKHPTQVIYKKCPQKMLRFYERHVKVIRNENKPSNGDQEE